VSGRLLGRLGMTMKGEPAVLRSISEVVAVPGRFFGKLRMTLKDEPAFLRRIETYTPTPVEASF